MLSIAIVTFNNQSTIIRTLASIIGNLPHHLPTQITVVDNQSTDSTLSQLLAFRGLHPEVAVISNSHNIGFGRAHTQALDTVHSQYHVICNPDIVVSDDIFTTLSMFLHQYPEIAITCPRFLNQDGTLQKLNHRYPTVMDLFLRRFIPEPFKPLFRRRLEAYEMEDAGYEQSCDVPFVSGAFMFCRTEVLKAIGGFDDRYFLYFEDADLCREVQARGFRTVYLPDVSVTHVWERMAHKNLRFSWIFIKSAFQYFCKWGFKWL